MTIEEIATQGAVTNRDLRIALHEILEMVEGLRESDRNRIAPRIRAALEASKDMATVFDVSAAVDSPCTDRRCPKER